MPWMIVAAVDSELRLLRGRMAIVASPRVKHGKVWMCRWNGALFCLVKTGMGPRKARAAVKELLAAGRFRGLVSIGFAGGLAPGWRVGDIVIPEQMATLPPLAETRALPDPELVRRMCRRAGAGAWPFHAGRMLTSRRVICSAREKGVLGGRHGAGSVEMESAVLGDLAREASLRFLVVRVISDEAGSSLPESLALLDLLRRRQWARVLRCLATQPVESVRFFRMMRHTRRASRSLTRFVVREVLDELCRDGAGGGVGARPAGAGESGGAGDHSRLKK